MSDQITFSGVQLKAFARSPKTGGTAHFSSKFTKPLCTAMGWGGLNPGQRSAKFESEIHATSLELAPKEGALAKHKIQIDVKTCYDFQVLRYEQEGTRGKGARFELHFKVDFADTNACRYLEEFMVTIGEGKSNMVVSYVKQSEFDLQATDEQREATGEEED